MPDVYSTYPLPQLLARWARGEITVEQLAGQLIQYVIRHDQRIEQLEKACGRAASGAPETGDAPVRPDPGH
ncbi:MAG: hypothetical protein U0350_05005 [Caldilineaceae bacterium]